jgi:hypothetical protein
MGENQGGRLPFLMTEKDERSSVLQKALSLTMKKTGLQKRIFEGLFIMLFIRLLLFPSGRSFFFRLTLHELSTLYRI